MTIAPTDDVWLSIDEFCAVTHLTKATIYNRKTRGQDLPPYYKIGRELRFRKSEVDAWLVAQRCVTPDSKTLVPGEQPRSWKPRGLQAAPRQLDQPPRPWEQ